MRISACVAAVMAALTFAAHAAPIPGQGTWETTLQGRDLDGDLSNGYEAYYDTVLNITWAANANRFYDPENFDYGRFHHASLPYTLEHLSINGYTGWRLPKATPVNGVSWSYDRPEGGLHDFGENLSLENSELAHLYYSTLGNSYCSLSDAACGYHSGFSIINSGPFTGLGLVREAYWTDGYFSHDYGDLGQLPTGVVFFMQSGVQTGLAMEGFIFEWALLWPVRDGDIALPVPEGDAMMYLAAGLLTSALLARRRQRQAAGARAPAHGQR